MFDENGLDKYNVFFCTNLRHPFISAYKLIPRIPHEKLFDNASFQNLFDNCFLVFIKNIFYAIKIK
jgi:hypothetical protein